MQSLLEHSPFLYHVIQNDVAAAKEALSADPEQLEFSIEFNGRGFLWNAVDFAVIKHANPAMLSFLIEAKADISDPNVIYQPVTTDAFDCVKLLINNGVSVDTALDNTPILYRAVARNHERIVTFLLQRNANPNAHYKGCSAVYMAVQENYLGCLNALIGAKASLDDYFSGVTPIYRAVEQGHAEAVRLLISAQADIHKPAIEGATPTYKAAAEGHVGCLDLLLNAGGDPNTALNGCSAVYIAVQNGHDACVSRLIRANANLNTPMGGYTPLMKAGMMNHLSTLTLLLTEGKGKVDLNQTFNNVQGATALYLLAGLGKTVAVTDLLDAGADKNILTVKGHGAIYSAWINKHDECVTAIRDHHASGYLSIHTSVPNHEIHLYPLDHMPQIGVAQLAPAADADALQSLGLFRTGSLRVVTSYLINDVENSDDEEKSDLAEGVVSLRL